MCITRAWRTKRSYAASPGRSSATVQTSVFGVVVRPREVGRRLHEPVRRQMLPAMSSSRTLRARLYALVEVPPDQTGRATLDWFDLVIGSLIVVSVILAVLTTVPSIDAAAGGVLEVVEYTFACIFAGEYLMRLWTCVENPRFAHPVLGRLKFIFSPLAIVDLLSFLPTLYPLTSANLAVLRVARLLRVLRVLKLGRYSRALTTLGRVLSSRRAELAAMGIATMLVLLVAATLMYYLEHEAQPERFSSIPESMWWAIVTLTTIGYGDAYPITSLGKAVGGVVALCGIGVVALPTAIIAQAFAEELRGQKSGSPSKSDQHFACPHCGKAIPGDPAGRCQGP